MKKTLSLPAAEDERPLALERKGRGWAISGSRLDTLHGTARELRAHPTEAQKLLAAALIAAELGKFRFRRQVVIGSAILDFACQPLRLAVEVEEPTDVDPAIEHRRDRSLAEVGIKVMRFPAAQVLEDVAGVTAAIIAEMKQRYEDQRHRKSVGGAGSRAGTAGRGYQR